MIVKWSERFPGTKSGEIENVTEVTILDSEVIVIPGYKNGSARHFLRGQYIVEVKESK